MRLFYYLSTGFDRPGPSYHLLYAHIADALAAGDEVFCLCTVTDLNHRAVPEEFSDNPKFSYRAIYIKDQKKSNFVGRYLSAAACFFRGRKELRIARDYDVIFCQSSFCAPFSVSFAKHYSAGRPVVYNVQDVFPGSSIASGVMTARWMQRVFAAFQKVAYRRADAITVISDDMRDKIKEQGVSDDKIHTILNWYDDKTVEEVPWRENRFVEKYHLSPEAFFVQYAGTTGYVFDYKAYLYAADKLRDETGVRFQIVASGSQLEAFKAGARALNLKNIDFLPLEPQGMVADVYSACSVCLIPLKKGVIGNSVPSKAGLLMACKRPVINSVDEGTSYYREFNENGIGISVPNDDYDALVDAIRRLRDNPGLRSSMGERAYEYGKERYSRTTNIRKYRQLFERLRADNPRDGGGR